MIKVRIAATSDAAKILQIYSPYILTTAVSFETDVPSVKDFEGRIKKCLTRYPWVVCEAGKEMAGYAYASVHREREAYQWTCECSVYLHPDYKGKGIGHILYKTLFQILKIQGFINLYAGITLPNEASVKLHEKCGFHLFALYENVGYKFDAWQKVGWWRLQLNELQPKPTPPVRFSELDPSSFTDILKQSAKQIEARLFS